jgi:short-subunit dehydrogenase
MKKIAIMGAAGMAAAGVAAGVAAGAGVGLAGLGIWRRFNASIDLHGRVVLITGGSRGLGLAMAKEFAGNGARVAICARDEGELERAQQELRRSGTDVFATRCDVTVIDEVQRMVDQVIARFGRIDVLVNNAGIISVGPLESQTLTDFQESMDVMFWGVLYPTLAVLPHMKSQHEGRIANITSIGGKVAVPHLLPYSCAKFAAVGFSEGLRAELTKDNIKVTTVVPGLMRTGSHLNAYFKGKHSAEYTWFAAGATSPVASTSARHAARRIVNAVKRGTAEIIITPQARLVALAHGVAPGATSDLMGLVNRMLPGAGGVGQERRTGNESETQVTRSVFFELGRKAARDLNQYPEKRTQPSVA